MATWSEVRRTLERLASAEISARRAHNALVAVANAGLATERDVAEWDAIRTHLYGIEMSAYGQIDQTLAQLVDDPVSGAAFGTAVSALRRAIPQPEMLPAVHADIPTRQNPIEASRNVAWPTVVLFAILALAVAFVALLIWDMETDEIELESRRLEQHAQAGHARWTRMLQLYQECVAGGGTRDECAHVAAQLSPDIAPPLHPPATGSSLTYLLLGAGAVAVLGFLMLARAPRGGGE